MTQLVHEALKRPSELLDRRIDLRRARQARRPFQCVDLLVAMSSGRVVRPIEHVINVRSRRVWLCGTAFARHLQWPGTTRERSDVERADGRMQAAT